MSFAEAVILAIIEGITEFLPVSSTGHMIIGSSVMGISEKEFTKIFTVAIQLGAILSVLALYWKRFFRSFGFYKKLFAAFIPSAIAGVLLNDYIDAMLESVIVVAIMLFLGGCVFLFVDRWFQKPVISDSDSIGYAQAFRIGLFQIISMIPGVSRSAATIIGGLSQKLSRKAAAEFSFFLAVPTMLGATCLKIFTYYKDGNSFSGEEIQALLLGNAVAFVVAMLAIKTFIGILNRYGFKIFGYYRIALGLIILILHFSGIKLSVI